MAFNHVFERAACALGVWGLSFTLTKLPHAAEQARNMVQVPAGTFIMGSDDGPADERPAHAVLVPAFYIDRLPVTNATFAAFLQAVNWSSVSGPRLYDHDDPDARARGTTISDFAVRLTPPRPRNTGNRFEQTQDAVQLG